MSNYSIHTNKFNTATIIKMCIMGFLICGFVYGCSNAKGKKNAKSPKTVTQPGQNTGTKQVSNQKSYNAQTKQGSKQADPQSPKKKKRKITQNWKTFFLGSTSAKVRMHLLQNGQKFKKVLKNFSQSSMAQKASATVTGIKLTSDTTAKVSYTINIGGAPILKNKTGKALYLNGTWKVGDGAFCSLIELSGKTPEPCKGV